MLLIGGIALFVGNCATIVQPTFEKSNQYFLEQTIDKLKIGEQLIGKIPAGSSVALVSIEVTRENDWMDKAPIAMIEDQLIKSLVENGFKVVERDEDALRNLIREGTNKNYSLSHDQWEDAIYSPFYDRWPSITDTLPKLPFDVPDPTFQLYETQMKGADYLVSYRVLEAGILYKKNDNINSTKEIREGLVRLNVRAQSTKNGEIVWVGNLQGQNEDKVEKTLVPQLANFHYSYFGHKYPLQPKKKKEKLIEVKTARKSEGSKRFFLKPGLGIVNDGELALGLSWYFASIKDGKIGLSWYITPDTEAIVSASLIYEKEVKNQILLQAGLGFSRVRSRHYDDYDYDYYESTSLHIGIAREKAKNNFVFKPSIELNLGLDDDNATNGGIFLNVGRKF